MTPAGVENVGPLAAVARARIVPLNELESKGQRLVQFDRVGVEGDFDLADRSPPELIGKKAAVVPHQHQEAGIAFEGKISYIHPQANADGKHRIRVTVDNRQIDGKWLLVPGATAQLTIPAATRKGVGTMLERAKSASGESDQPRQLDAGNGTGIPLKRGDVYSCSTHPQIRQIAPGKCPICGMALGPTEGGSLSHAKLADATELRIAIAKLKDEVRTCEALSQKSPDDQEIASKLESARRQLAIRRDELAAQIQLLEFELKDAQSAADLAGKSLDQVKQLENGAIPRSHITKAQRDLATAQLRVDRVRTLLELYRKADPPSDLQRDSQSSNDAPPVPDRSDAPLKPFKEPAVISEDPRKTIKFSDPVSAVEYSPGGKHVAVATGNLIVVVDAKTGEQVFEINGHEERVWRVTYSPNGRLLASASRDRTVRLWDSATGILVGPMRLYSSEVRWVMFSPNGRSLLIAPDERGNHPIVFDTLPQSTTDRGARRTVWGARSTIFELSIAPQSHLLASAEAGGRLHVWDYRSGKIRWYGTHREGVISVQFSPNEKLLASGGWDNKLRIWHTEDGKRPKIIDAPGTHGVDTLQWLLDSQFVVFGLRDGTIGMVDANSGQVLQHFQAHKGPLFDLALSPGGGTLVSGGSEDKTVKFWDIIITKRAQPDAPNHSGASDADIRERIEKYERAFRVQTETGASQDRPKEKSCPLDVLQDLGKPDVTAADLARMEALFDARKQIERQIQQRDDRATVVPLPAEEQGKLKSLANPFGTKTAGAVTYKFGNVNSPVLLILNALSRGKPDRGSGDSGLQAVLNQHEARGGPDSDLLRLEYRRELFRWAARQIQKEFQPDTWNAFG